MKKSILLSNSIVLISIFYILGARVISLDSFNNFSGDSLFKSIQENYSVKNVIDNYKTMTDYVPDPSTKWLRFKCILSGDISRT